MKTKRKHYEKRRVIPHVNITVYLSVVIGAWVLMSHELHFAIRIVLSPLVIGMWVLGSGVMWQWATYHAPKSRQWWEE